VRDDIPNGDPSLLRQARTAIGSGTVVRRMRTPRYGRGCQRVSPRPVSPVDRSRLQMKAGPGSIRCNSRPPRACESGSRVLGAMRGEWNISLKRRGDLPDMLVRGRVTAVEVSRGRASARSRILERVSRRPPAGRGCPRPHRCRPRRPPSNFCATRIDDQSRGERDPTPKSIGHEEPVRRSGLFG
jgi:hypothetical protein